MTQAGIYAIRNAVDGKVYVGQAANIRNRWGTHRHHLRHGTHHSSHLQRAWLKYGEPNFNFEVLEILAVGRDAAEQRWMDGLKAADRSFGYNMQPTAASSRGYHLSEETKRKISAAQKGRPVPQARRELLRLAATGQIKSAEAVRKQRLATTGLKRTVETKRRLSETQHVFNNSQKFCAFSKTAYLKEWAAEFGVNYATLSNRIKRGGMTLEDALLMPLSKGVRRDLLVVTQ